MEEEVTQHEFDVIIIGAGGAGLRAAIEASRSGVKVAMICKSMLGKAHTVMAEGGAAAAGTSTASSNTGRAGIDTVKTSKPSRADGRLMLLGQRVRGHVCCRGARGQAVRR